jgi:ABC-type phosphate/phosphonate transport system permease subunit
VDCQQGFWRVTDFPEDAWGASIDLARRYGPAPGIRALDSLHVGCALALYAEKFRTFDDRQARLAEAVGLDTSS